MLAVRRKTAEARHAAPSPLITAPPQTVEGDRAKRRAASDAANLKQKYEIALKTIEGQERELRAMNVLGSHVDTAVIKPKEGSGTSEGTVVMVASDWHIEENVGSEVGGAQPL